MNQTKNSDPSAAADPVLQNNPVTVEVTPNPQTRKFLTGHDVSPGGPLVFHTTEEAKDSPLAQKIFQVAGVQALFFGYNFISITKKQDVLWDTLESSLKEVMIQALEDKVPVWTASQSAEDTTKNQAAHKAEEGTIERDIQDLLDQRIRPFVARDGGDIVFHKFEEGTVYLHMRGACSGCPSSAVTLKQGVENMLRHFIPEVQHVEAVQDAS